MHIAETNDEVMRLIDSDAVHPDRIVMVEEHPEYPGELVFQVLPDSKVMFYSRYRDWISRYLVLNELFNVEPFIAQIEKDGWDVVLGPSSLPVMTNWARWKQEFKVEGYDLYGFQQFSLQRAFESDFWFFNWSTGAGKSLVSTVGAKELFVRDMIDHVILCCPSAAKINMCRFFETAGIDAVVNDGTKAKRGKVYEEAHQAYVMNYQKLNFDRGYLEKLCRGRRILFVMDECQHVVTDTPRKKNQARLAFEHLRGLCAGGSKIWAMSASVVNGNPLRFRDVFELGNRPNPLRGSEDFINRYAKSIKTVTLSTQRGRTFDLVSYDWDEWKLQEVRHRVGALTQTARKTDPALAPLFKDMRTLVEPIQMGKLEAQITEAIIDRAREAREKGQSLGPYYDTLRYVINTPEALLVTEHEFAQELASDFRESIKKTTATKLDVLNAQLDSIRESGDQVVVFTHWTNLTLHLIANKIEVPLVLHYGTGQKARDSQKAHDDFKTNSNITCFLTSDAGKEALSFQNARYVIQFEPTYSYDDGYQRASRIHRADSYLDGLTNYIYVTENSVEERVWAVNYGRRVISETTQGTVESLNFGHVDHECIQRSEAQNTSWLIFGSEG